MDEMRQMAFNSSFMSTLVKAQNEAMRLGAYYVSAVTILRTLIADPDSSMGQFLEMYGVNWKKVNDSIEKQVRLSIKELGDPKVISMNFSTGEEEGPIVNVEDETFNLICNATAFASDLTTVTEVEFVLSMLDEGIQKYVLDFFRQVKLNIMLVIRYYEGIMAENAADMLNSGSETDSSDEDDEEVELDEGGMYSAREAVIEMKIPGELMGIVKVMKVDPERGSLILGREKETEALIKVLLKHKKCNAILVGEPGVGKTAIIESLVYKIANGDVPDELKKKVVITLDVNSLVSGTIFRGMAEERFEMLASFLEGVTDAILFIDEIHTMIGAGKGMDNSLDMANSLKPILAREGVSVIGATTLEEYEFYFSSDKATKRRFEKIEVKEPTFDEVYPMVKAQVKNLSNVHGISIPKTIIDYIVCVAPCFSFETKNPDLTLDLIDKAMATAKLMGQKVVTKQMVLNNFEANFKQYSKMDENLKMATAYHEAGHFLVEKYSKHLAKAKALAISIIPAGGYLGLCVTDPEQYDLVEWNYEAHLEGIAGLLAGRAAEKMYASSVSSGASNDLERATEAAKNMVKKYAFVPAFSKRNFEKELDADSLKKMNEEVDKIIEQASKLADTILKEHEGTLKKIATLLCKEGILIGPELEKICKTEERRVAVVK